MEPEADDWSEADDGIEFFDVQTGAPVSDAFAHVLAIGHDDHVHVAPDPWQDNRNLRNVIVARHPEYDIKWEAIARDDWDWLLASREPLGGRSAGRGTSA